MRRLQSRFVVPAFVTVTRRFYATRYFTDTHEWVEVENNVATVGITHHAQESLGDIIYIGLPNVGDSVEAKQTFGEVESVKATANIYTPVGGTVVEVNEEAKATPKIINDSAEDKAWLIKLKTQNAALSGFMTKAQYDEFLKSSEGH